MTRKTCGAGSRHLFLLGALAFFWLSSLAGFSVRAQTAGLVAAYAFSEGAGTTVGDASGNGNTGTINGATWTAAGRYGAALTFDGTNDLVLIQHSDSLNLRTAMTLEAWVFPTAAQSGWRTIIHKAVDAYFLHASTGGAPLSPSGGGTFNGVVDRLAAPRALTVNAWTHVALTWNGSIMRLYVNGIEAANEARSGPMQRTTRPLRIGGNGPFGQFFRGRIDEVRVYDRALSAAEIQSDMNTPVASTTPEAPTVSLTANPTSVAGGGSSTLTWSSTNAIGCTASGGWSGTKATSGSQSTGALTANSNFTLTCTGAGGSASASATVTVTGAPPPVPTVSLTANPTSVTSGGASTLTWNSTNATSCSASGGWSGTRATSGSQSTGALTASSNFTLTCTGAGGSASASAAVTVTAAPPVPTVSLTANPTSVTSGGASTLTWNSTNATSCMASGGWSGTKVTSGSQSTGGLTASTDFFLTCSGAGGNASVSARVTVTASMMPTASLTANPTSVTSGGSSTLTWSSTNATSCTASGDWSGTKATSGSQSTGALTSSSNFALTCSGAGGNASASATVTVTAAGTSSGLDFPGDGAVRRMLFWRNPFPIYDATYVFRVFPRKKTTANSPTGYYTTFFWGNNGSFTWQNGNPNTYYGAHPYPIPAPNGPGQWEISVESNDFTTGSEVQWGRWYTQAFRAWRESSSITHHEFYWDLPDTSKVIRHTVVDSGWAKVNPPAPAIVMGQAPNVGGASWGGYPGWEEFNGVIRGIQFYSGLLSLADIQAEIANPMSTTAGRNLIWYLNLNPRPTDVADKKGVGTPNNPSWDGTTAREWVE